MGGRSFPELESLQGPQADAGATGEGDLLEVPIQTQTAQVRAQLRFQVADGRVGGFSY